MSMRIHFIKAIVALFFVANIHSFSVKKIPVVRTGLSQSYPGTISNERRNLKSSLFCSLVTNSGAQTPSKKVIVVGATGYIGKFVVQECTRRGFDTYAVLRPRPEDSQMPEVKEEFLSGATVLYGDVTNKDSIQDLLNKAIPNSDGDVSVISCLASRSGVKKDSYLIDYQATLNVMEAARAAQQTYLPENAIHFVLLSAFCVAKPLLQFQYAKLAFEEALTKAAESSQGRLRYSVVRPTAFFKSVSGQFELLQQGWPFVMFGNGEICKCNPIAESDLATYIVNCIEEKEKWNKILGKEPKFWTAPVELFDAIIGAFAWFGQFFPSMEDAAELGRIGKYYAVEDMLTTEPAEKFGSRTLKQHYTRISVEGQDYDPYTTMLASKKPNKNK
eukprot:gene26203-34824_t